MTVAQPLDEAERRPAPRLAPDLAHLVERVARFPRLRYMGSKYRLVPHLAAAFADLGGKKALDAFSGSGVVGYTLKALGYEVTVNDFLAFPCEIARAAIENDEVTLDHDDLALLTGPPRDDRSFIQATFSGLYFPDDDHKFLDGAWSHIDHLPTYKRSLAIASLVLAAARKQPRGVFTITDLRYDDGRRQLRQPMRELFVEAAAEYTAAVFQGSANCRALSRDVFELDGQGFDLVYLDPPYAPPKDDNCYIKRYHFLEGLAVYWRGCEILPETKTKKLKKRYTPFSYKHTITDALERTIAQFASSDIVLSYSSNAVPNAETILALLRNVKSTAEVRTIDHSYSFGTHERANRRNVTEYLFIGVG